MKPTLIHLPPELVERLDGQARREGVSRSQVIRDAVTAFLSVEGRAELSERVAEAYRRQPLSTEDEWGDLDSFLEAVRAARASSS